MTTHCLVNRITFPRINSRVFWLLSILLTITFLVFYIFQVNAEVSERYLTQEYQKRITEISKENQSLEISSAQINSLDNLTLLLEGLNFEETDKIHYIQVLDTQVVVYE